MNINNINPNHPAYGKISINTYNGGKEHLFGQAKNGGSAVCLDIHQADLSDSFGRITRLGAGRTFCKMNMTIEQWSELLLNKNNKNGTPVTIEFDQNGNVEQDIAKDTTTNKVFEDFSKLIKTKFQDVYNLEKDTQSILLKEKITAEDRNEIKGLFDSVSDKILKDSKFLENEIDQFITNVEASAEDRFISGIKKNILNIEETKLLAGGETEIIENDYQGILVLNTIEGVKNSLIKDYEADNGISLTLYRAIVKKNGNLQNIEKTEEKLFEIRMSNSQFSELMTSFGRGDVACTIAHKFGQDIETCNENINDEIEDIYKLLEFIDKIESDVKELKEEVYPLLSKSISNKTKQTINFVFEKSSRLVGVNLLFYCSQVFKSGLKYSIRRQEDVQSGIMNSIQKKGVEQLQNDIKSLSNENSTKLLDNLTQK